MQSSKSKAVEWLLRLSGVKALTEWTDGDILSWIIEKDLLWEAEVPKWLSLQRDVIQNAPDEPRYFHFLSTEKSPYPHVFYVHGGGFLMEIYFLYWLFIYRLLKSTGAEVMVPIYPLIPHANFDEAYDHVKTVYLRWRETIPRGEMVHLIADSSGCALALRLAQEIGPFGKGRADNVILISPWINMDVKEQTLEDYAEIDPFISVAALKHCAKLAVPSEEYDNPRYSPLNGPLQGIGKISVFTGTADTLYPDSLALYQKAQREHVAINYYEHRNMFHIYPQFPVAEGIEAFSFIEKLLSMTPYQKKESFVVKKE